VRGGEEGKGGEEERGGKGEREGEEGERGGEGIIVLEDCQLRTLDSPLSSSLIVWVCLHSNFRGGLRKTHVF